MLLSDLNEAMIRRHAGGEVFERGRACSTSDAVSDVFLRGGTLLTAHVQGSEIDPYRVRVRLGKTTIEDAECDCPYGDNFDGWCKHIVATLLWVVDAPAAVEVVPVLADLLAPLPPDVLRAAVLSVGEANEDFADALIRAVAAVSAPPPQARATSSAAPARPAFPPVDANAVRKQMRSLLRRSSHYGEGGPSDAVTEPVHKAGERLNRGDARGALLILDAVMDEYLSEWMNSDDEDAGSEFEEMADIATGALLSIEDWQPGERQQWRDTVAVWHRETSDYGIEDFGSTVVAAEQGWDDPDLRAVLSGASDVLPAESWRAARLTEIRIEMLERRGDGEGALRLAKAAQEGGAVVRLLAREGRSAEAVAWAKKHCQSAAQCLEVARALDAADDLPGALEIGAHGLALREGDERDRGALAVWVRDAAAGANRSDLAREAALIALEDDTRLSNWEAAERLLAPDEWQRVKAALLHGLRRSKPDDGTYRARNAAEIFLHEGLLEDALTAATQTQDGVLLGRVADAAAGAHPDAVLKAIAGRADAQMRAGGRYAEARDWLRREKTALLAAGRPAEWGERLATALREHARKYTLTPLLKELL